MPRILTLFASEIRVIDSREILQRRKTMQNQEETAGKDIFLFLFVGVALWLLIFQSGLFN